MSVTDQHKSDILFSIATISESITLPITLQVTFVSLASRPIEPFGYTLNPSKLVWL